jgi:hypothetical protein
VNDKPTRNSSSLLKIAAVIGTCLVLPLACSDDDSPSPFSDGGTGGESGGGKATGGKTGSGGKATGGLGGAGGGPASGGAVATGGTPSSGGSSTGGAVTVTGGAPDVLDGGGDGEPPDGGPSCAAPTNAAAARLCLKFAPDTVTFGATPDLDGKGSLLITIFKTATPTGAGDVVGQRMLSLPTGTDAPLDVTNLPPQDFDGLPETVYIRTLFIDNAAWFAKQTGLMYGMFVGGLNLNDGVKPAPGLRAVTLKKGLGTDVSQRLVVLRKYTTTLTLKEGVTPADDGQGPLSLGVFTQQSPTGAAIFGGVEVACTDVTKGPIPLTGFFYSLSVPSTGATMWFGGQLDDFNQLAVTPPGSLVSLTGGLIPVDQSLKVMPGDYSVTVPHVELNFVLGGSTGFPHYACPTTGGGTPDAGGGDGG